jgi:hypothetical protein
VLIYGVEGIGKTTLAAAFPDPLFIDTEGSTYHLDVKRTDKPNSWDDLILTVQEVWKAPGLCKTLVIDTLDWAEQLCVAHVCKANGKASIEAFGYGKGYTILSETFGALLKELDNVIEGGCNVVLTAHAKMRKFEEPNETGSYDRWELKLSKNVAPLVKEWADMVLFANYKTVLVADENGKKKAQGGRRVLYTTHHPCWDAKNRHGLPDELELSYKPLAGVIPNGPAKPAAPSASVQEDTGKASTASAAGVPERLLKLMQQDDIAEEEVRKVIVDRGKFRPATWAEMDQAGFIDGWVIPYWANIRDMIQSDPNRLPF